MQLSKLHGRKPLNCPTASTTEIKIEIPVLDGEFAVVTNVTLQIDGGIDTTQLWGKIYVGATQPVYDTQELATGWFKRTETATNHTQRNVVFNGFCVLPDASELSIFAAVTNQSGTDYVCRLTYTGFKVIL